MSRSITLEQAMLLMREGEGLSVESEEKGME